MALRLFHHVDGAGEHVLRCRGRLDMSTLALLRSPVLRHLDATGADLTIDLRSLEHLDVASAVGLAVLTAAFRRRGRTLSVREPLDPEVGRFLDYCGLSSLLVA